MQQEGASANATSGSTQLLSQRSDAAEQEAEAVTNLALAGDAVEVKAKPSAVVSRVEWQGALDTAASISEWANPAAWPAAASTHILNLVTDQMQQNPNAGVMDVLSGSFNAEHQQEQQAAASVRETEHSFGQGAEWLEGQISGGAHWLADQAHRCTRP